MSKFKVIERENGTKRYQTVIEGISMTEQSHKKETDINNIMSKYQKTGVLTFVNSQQPIYAEMASTDLQTAMNTVINAQDMFDNMPAEIRKEFDNDPVKFLQQMDNPEYQERARELGLLPTPRELETALDIETPPPAEPTPPPAE